MALAHIKTEFNPEKAFDSVAPVKHEDIQENAEALDFRNRDEHGKKGFTGQYGVIVDVQNHSLELERF